MSDPSGYKSAILQRAAQPPGESAAGDGMKGKYLCGRPPFLVKSFWFGFSFERAFWHTDQR